MAAIDSEDDLPLQFPCVCGKQLVLDRLPHPETGEPCLAIQHDMPQCDEFMVDRPLDQFLLALRLRRGPCA